MTQADRARRLWLRVGAPGPAALRIIEEELGAAVAEEQARCIGLFVQEADREPWPGSGMVCVNAVRRIREGQSP